MTEEKLFIFININEWIILSYHTLTLKQTKSQIKLTQIRKIKLKTNKTGKQLKSSKN